MSTSILLYSITLSKYSSCTSSINLNALDKEAIKYHYLHASGNTDPNKTDRLMERFVVLSEFVELKSSYQSRRLTNTI